LYITKYIVKVYITYHAIYNVVMSKEGRGRVVCVGKARTRYVTIPADVAGDSAFPFADGEEVKISISGRRLIIEPVG